MKIGIDARLYSQTGIGRYIRNLLRHLAILDKKNEYLVFLSPEDYQKFRLPSKNWQKIKVDIAWHSFSEQIKMPFLLYKHGLDLVHFPYFNVPLLYLKPFVVTLHDLTIYKQPTGKASTRPLWYYFLKKMGYLAELWFISKKAKKVITISNFVKKDIIKILDIKAARIKVIYEAVDKKLLRGRGKNIVKSPYFLTVGNFYPHKNLTRLIFALRKLIVNPEYKDFKLLLVGPKDYFYRRLKKFLKDKNLLGRVQFILNSSDERLACFYKNAQFLLFPSLAEGFGLPGLEAMALRCPVMCSSLQVFKEVYQDVPIYFDPHDVDDIFLKLKKGLKEGKKARKERIQKGVRLASKYSWKNCAKQTLAVYESCLSL